MTETVTSAEELRVANRAVVEAFFASNLDRPEERLALLQTAVAAEIEAAFRLVNCEKFVAAAERIGQQMEKILKEVASSGDVILCIDEIHEGDLAEDFPAVGSGGHGDDGLVPVRPAI